MKEKQLLELISQWTISNNFQREINKMLYEKTELFEGKTHLDFKEDLHDFFAKKICRYSKEENQLIKLLEKYQLIEEFAKIKNNYIKKIYKDKEIQEEIQKDLEKIKNKSNFKTFGEIYNKDRKEK